jgi:S1/P1 Nuclease
VKIFLTACLIAVLLLCSPRLACAWSGPGNMIIAAEAYRNLSPALQARVTEILKAHPDYAKWETPYAKYGDSIDFATSIFMRASTWPDEIRRGGGADKQYDHPHWHYVDYPLTPPAFPMEPGPAPNDDVLYGIAQCEQTLSDTKASPKLKAGLSV